MNFPRRSLLLGGLLALAGCTGDPRVEVDPDAVPRAQPPDEPVQDPRFEAAAEAIGAVREQVESTESRDWRRSALAQCDAQLARFNSVAPFGDPDPVFSPAPGSSPDLDSSVESAVAVLVRSASESPDVAERLLLLSAAAATSALRDASSVPGEGGEPTWVGGLDPQRPVALGHAWALIHGIETALGRVAADDPLGAALTARLASAKAQRNELRDGIDGVAPSQPVGFDLPTPMGTEDEIRSGWATLEVRLLESLVLLAADEDAADRMWEAQLAHAQAAGGRVPRWPGWD